MSAKVPNGVSITGMNGHAPQRVIQMNILSVHDGEVSGLGDGGER